MDEADFGIIGLGVMGENLALNVASRGFSLVVYNRTAERTRRFMAGAAAGTSIRAAYSLEEFVAALARPRRLLLMVSAGPAVDALRQQLRPLLEPGDIVIDGGNSFFRDTERRSQEWEGTGLHFYGLGISGGEAGARHGPSLMPGGPPEAYARLEPILTRLAAQVEDGPCCAYLGPRGAGHFVKMVHNGIEYGDMQLIAEAYDLLRHGLNLPAEEVREVFAAWNQGELQSYLIEITRDIVAFPDPETGQPLVERILDQAEQKGTGKWTTQTALDLGVPTPTLNAAVDARLMSACKAERVAAARLLRGPAARFTGDRAEFIAALRAALYASKICAYAQGMALLRAASAEFQYGLPLGEIARIWKGGCVIRAAFLGRIQKAFARDPDLPNLLLDEDFREEVAARQEPWRTVVQTGLELGLPLPAMSASLAYFDAYRRERLPANLIQAQRDYFGAHTYRRIDREGTFHTSWAPE
jgi:6-phosphogluconate dehydrogenase